MAQDDRNIVLVHGAWADGHSWSRVIERLGISGIKAVTAPLPLTSFAEDVAALERAIDRIDGALILVGHAYAGAVISATHSQKLKALVYVAALAPAEGQTVADVFYMNAPDPQAPQLAPDAGGFIWLPDAAFASAFAPNASPHEQDVLRAIQRPISTACITVPVGRPRWLDVPAWYLLAEGDRMIAPATQRFMAERMKASISAHAVDHTPSVTAPEVLVALLTDVLRHVRA